MSGSGNQEPDLGRETDAGSPKLALATLNTPRNHTKPYDPLAPPPKPVLASDPKPKASNSYRGSDETVSSVWSVSSVLSFFIGTNSGTSSATTSRTNSTNFDEISKQGRTSRPPVTSRFSTWTLDVADQSSGEKLYPSINALVRESSRVGVYRGFVDIWQRKIIHEEWREQFWGKADDYETILELSKEAESNDICKEIPPPEPALGVDKELPPTPASTQQSMGGTSRLELPVSAPSSPRKPHIRPASGLSSANNLNRNASQVSLSSTADSFHTAPTRSREHSVTSTVSAQHVTQHSTHSPFSTMLSVDSIYSRIEYDTVYPQSAAVQGSNIPEHLIVPDGTDTLGGVPNTSIPNTSSVKTEGPTNTALDHVSGTINSGATIDELCQRDVRIFHPTLEVAITTIGKIDCGSDHSHISPKALRRLQISLDSELIRPTVYKYYTNEGPVETTRGSITLNWRIFNEPNGHSKHERNTFYIASDKAPYDGLLLGKDFLYPPDGPARMNLCLVNIPIPKTEKEKEEQRKALEKHEREVRENERLKKERRDAAQQAAGSSSKTKDGAAGRK